MRFIPAIILFFILPAVFGQENPIQRKNFDISYSDSAFVKNTIIDIEAGIKSIEKFFNRPFKGRFYIKVFSERKSLDRFWQEDWKAPDFQSQCWMVASGDAKGIAMLSPSAWSTQACEHSAADLAGTRKLLTHELIHVFHSQYGPGSSDEQLEKIGWLVEGLATYASGQLDEKRMLQTRQSIADGKIPNELENFWSGKGRYGQSGSLVQWIDNKYGRDFLFRLLSLSTEAEILDKLKLSEQQLIEAWKKSLM